MIKRNRFFVIKFFHNLQCMVSKGYNFGVVKQKKSVFSINYKRKDLFIVPRLNIIFVVLQSLIISIGSMLLSLTNIWSTKFYCLMIKFVHMIFSVLIIKFACFS